MANAIYPKFKEAVMSGDVDMLTGVVKATLVNPAVYTYDPAHTLVTSLTGRVGTDQTLAGKSVTNGFFNSDNPIWDDVAEGQAVGAIVIYVDDQLVAYIDSGQTGLPFVSNGSEFTFNVNPQGWFRL